VTGFGLELVSATLSYPGRMVAEDLTLAFPSASITAILGPNGCGKSTVLRAMTRILRPAAGEARLDGRNIHSIPANRLARRLALLPQSPHAPDGLSVRDLVSFGRFPYRGWLGDSDAAGSAAVDRALHAVALHDISHRLVSTLSGGQRQRAWIAMTLAQETEYLLLDEPTTFLDPAHQIEVMDLVRLLKDSLGKTIVIVLHDLSLAARYADFVVMLKHGRIVSQGTPERALTFQTIRDVFGIDAELLRDGDGRIQAVAPLKQTRQEIEA
jgi:iron complex transport system ATP-binding protein